MGEGKISQTELWINLAETLTKISEKLPEDYRLKFPRDSSLQQDKYTIKPAQVRTASRGEVAFMKNYFYEACNIYVYGKPSFHPDFIDEWELMPVEGSEKKSDEVLTEKPVQGRAGKPNGGPNEKTDYVFPDKTHENTLENQSPELILTSMVIIVLFFLAFILLYQRFG